MKRLEISNTKIVILSDSEGSIIRAAGNPALGEYVDRSFAIAQDDKQNNDR